MVSTVTSVPIVTLKVAMNSSYSNLTGKYSITGFCGWEKLIEKYAGRKIRNWCIEII